MASGNPVMKFYSAWFCPYAQRAWITLNYLKLEYDLIESLIKDDVNDVYIKNKALLEINPKGLVPTLHINGEVLTESIDLIGYLHKYSGNDEVDLNFVTADLEQEARRMNASICSPFFQIFKKEDASEQDVVWEGFVSGLNEFAEQLQSEGFYKSSTLNIVDITVFPWVYRLYLVEVYRKRSLDQSLAWVKKLYEWHDRMMSHKAVRDTIPDKDKMIESYAKTLKKWGVSYSK